MGLFMFFQLGKIFSKYLWQDLVQTCSTITKKTSGPIHSQEANCCMLILAYMLPPAY